MHTKNCISPLILMRTTSISPLTLPWSFPVHINMPLHYYNMLKDMTVSCSPLLLNYKYCPAMGMWIQMLLNKKILLFTFRDHNTTIENQLPPDWIPCSSAGTGNTRGLCSSSDRRWLYFSQAMVFLKNAQSKSAERTWHIMNTSNETGILRLIPKSDDLIDLYSNIDSIFTYFSLFHPVNWKDWTGYWLYQGSQYCPPFS